MKNLLEINKLHTYFKTRRGLIKAVNGVSCTIEEGKTLGLVGESGSGKSQTAMSILQLFEPNQKIYDGEIIFDGKKISDYKRSQMEKIRGNDISMIFQEPMSSLNPVFTVEKQISEVLILHKKMNKKEAAKRVEELLAQVKIPNPHVVAKQYPFELSGGMNQRVMIAMALACEPKLLIADEPTTALDVTIQAQILELIKEFQERTKMSVIFITHNLAVVAQICDKVSVMYAGRIVEQASVEEIFYNPKHPYTKGLLKSMPRIDSKEQTRLESIKGSPVDMLNPPKGCGFSARCDYCMNICLRQEPPMIEMENGHKSKCFLHVKELVDGR